MKLSIIIPVYNAEKYLKRCLDSVLKQSIEEKEIICVDDGSTDNSLVILCEYANKYDNFYVLEQENKFAGEARNYGLTIAKGEYIHFLDADDYILSDIYPQIYSLAVKKNADYIKTRNVAFDMCSGKRIEISAYTLKNLNIHCFSKLLSLDKHPEMLLYNSVTPWCGWVKKNYIKEKQIKFNGLRCVNDRSFYAEIISNTEKIVLIDCYMVAHQINNRNSLVGESNESYICQLESYRIIEKKMEKCPVEIRKKIMTAELDTVFRAYGNLPDELKVKNNGLLSEFIEKLDWKNINLEILLCPAIKRISEEFKIELRNIFDIGLIIDSISDLKKCIKGKDHIVIYGAGKVGKTLVEYLKKGDFNVTCCIAVSNLSTNPGSVYGIPVKEASKKNLDCAQEIIIAILINERMSIYLDLINRGYRNIHVISDAVYSNLLSENLRHNIYL